MAQTALPKIVVMVSGGGTNLQALIDAIKAEHLRAQIALVVSNRKAAYGLTRAEQYGIPTHYASLKVATDGGKTREQYDTELGEKVAEFKPDLIVLAGWMHVLSSVFLNHFPNRVINLHPALPGEFPGTNAIERAYKAYNHGEIDQSGCMVHYVVPEVDAGPVLAKAVVHLDLRDSLTDFETRLHAAEHQLIVQATMLALERLTNGS
ncbi:MAG TPA: phosphoribosylglycinamide formyltransferase [Phototrophicaceae bacterium]|jgi:formyltetrahydrofolate-dependent phosphoribosylglycinamide formyltransferase|nr:phosphoribosylglycinamide formyltransferase [Phototrophicaceae bacterium]